jgi:large subunit ribosomal protein L15
MKLHDLRPADGATKERKRVGRGLGSGHGHSATRGTTGQGSRSGGTKAPYFEGGQLPLVRRLPWRRGFNNVNRVEYTPVNVGRLEVFDANCLITPEALAEAGIVKHSETPIKILAGGDLTKPLTVRAHKFSQAAQEKITAAGGQAELIE